MLSNQILKLNQRRDMIHRSNKKRQKRSASCMKGTRDGNSTAGHKMSACCSFNQYVSKNKNAIAKTVDLVPLAKTYPSTMKILVHFHTWESYLREKFFKANVSFYDNEYIPLYGGEYRLMDSYVKNLVANLRAVNIELVFYLSAAKGAAHSNWDKEDVLKPGWKSKAKETERATTRCIRFLKGEIPFEELDIDIEFIGRPALQEVQNVLTLKEAGCEFHMCLTESAESLMAKRLQSDRSTLGSFSESTDFCLFPDCIWLLPGRFDEEGDLGFIKPNLPTHGPTKLLCGILRSDIICRALKLPDHASLVELSILTGNRFVQRGWVTESVYDLPEKLRRFKVVEKWWPFSRYLVSNEDLKKSVEKSRLYYTLKLEENLENAPEPGDPYSILAQSVLEGRIPSTLLAMYQGLYCHRHVLEDTSQATITADGALSDLRAYIYSLVLPPERSVVREVGQSPESSLDTINVSKISGIPIPSLAQVQTKTFRSKRRLFELVIQHQEEKFLSEDSSYFNVYGDKLGFLCFLLRYFLRMNWQKNLHLKPEEFFVLVTWVLADHPSGSCMGLKIVPSPRSLTVKNWFLSLYRNAYAFLGNLLDLNHEFPAPKDLFSGSLWVALYEAVVKNDPSCRRSQHLRVPRNSLQLQEFRDIVHRVASDKQPLIEYIVEDFFNFSSVFPSCLS